MELNQPPSFMNNTDSSTQQTLNSIDLFNTLEWAHPFHNEVTPGVVSQETAPSEPELTRTQPPPLETPSVSNPTAMNSILSDFGQNFVKPISSNRDLTAESFKRDIVKYLFSKKNSSFLNTCFSSLEEIDILDDSALNHKFQLGLLLDSTLSTNNSEKHLASHLYTFFDVILNEIRSVSSNEIRPYIDIFIENSRKERIDILNDSGLHLVSSLLNANDLSEMLKTLKVTESPSTKAFRSTVQNIFLLLGLVASKKVFIPYVINSFGLKRNEPETDEIETLSNTTPPPSKRPRK